MMSKTKSYKLLLILGSTGLFLAILLAALLLTRGDATKDFLPKATIDTQEPAPDFRLELFDGSYFQLSEHKGKPVLINFFASWCVPCKEEIPVLEKIGREYTPKGVTFLAVAVNDSEEKARAFLQEHGLSFPAGLDKTGSVQETFGLYGVPTTFFITKQGMTNYIHAGGVTEDLLRHELDKLL